MCEPDARSSTLQEHSKKPICAENVLWKVRRQPQLGIATASKSFLAVVHEAGSYRSSESDAPCVTHVNRNMQRFPVTLCRDPLLSPGPGFPVSARTASSSQAWTPADGELEMPGPCLFSAPHPDLPDGVQIPAVHHLTTVPHMHEA